MDLCNGDSFYVSAEVRAADAGAHRLPPNCQVGPRHREPLLPHFRHSPGMLREETQSTERQHHFENFR